MTPRQFVMAIMAVDALCALTALAFNGSWHRQHAWHGGAEFVMILLDTWLFVWAKNYPDVSR